MEQRKRALPDNYRPAFIVAVLLLLLSNIAHAQNLTSTAAWGYDWNAGKYRTFLGVPNDTLTPPAALHNIPLIARKNGRTYYWNGTRWDVDTSGGGSGSGGVDYITKQNFSDTSNYDATRFWVLSQLNNYTPLSRFLDSLTAARLRYLKASDTTYLHTQLTTILSNNASNSNLIFSDGLVWSSVDNHVRAQFSSPIWNANRLQSYPISPVICNGCVPYLDSANRLIRWRVADSAAVSPIYDSIAQINLDLLATKQALKDTGDHLHTRIDNIGWVAVGPYLIKRPAGSVVGDRDSAQVDESALRALIESYQNDGTVVTGPDLSIDSIKVTGDVWKTYWFYRSSGRIDTAGFFDRSGINGTGPVYVEADPTIPHTTDATTNKYLNWNGSAWVRKQILASEINNNMGWLSPNAEGEYIIGGVDIGNNTLQVTTASNYGIRFKTLTSLFSVENTDTTNKAVTIQQSFTAKGSISQTAFKNNDWNVGNPMLGGYTYTGSGIGSLDFVTTGSGGPLTGTNAQGWIFDNQTAAANPNATWLQYSGGIVPILFKKNGDVVFSGNVTINGTTTTLGGGVATVLNSTSTSLTLTTYNYYTYSGTSAGTWTLPLLGAAGGPKKISIKNRSAYNLTIQRGGANQLYYTSAITSITLTPGSAYDFIDDGSYWNIL